MKTEFRNANEAFDYMYKSLNSSSERRSNTIRRQNVGFYIENPMDNEITLDYRAWSKKYAEREWEWYMSENRSVVELVKHAKIWDKMHNGNYIVNSNYGYQWNRNGQLDNVVKELRENKSSRRATITIHDAKEYEDHALDTPCTETIMFEIGNSGKLNMTVIMRSNDLWYGFCNDQYQFSKLLELVASRLEVGIGWYYHFTFDLHLYNSKIQKK